MMLPKNFLNILEQKVKSNYLGDYTQDNSNTIKVFDF